MIRGLIAAVLVFLIATFPATWLLMLFLGWVGKRRARSTEDYRVAGRRLGPEPRNAPKCPREGP